MEIFTIQLRIGNEANMSNIHLKSTGRASLPVVISLILLPLMVLVILLRSAGAGQVYSTGGEVKVHSVDVFQVETQPSYQRQLRAVGKVESTRQAKMGFERSGTLITTLSDEGQQVKKGDLLAELDTQRIIAQKQEVEATILRAKADARLADISANRIAKLVRDKLESAQRLDEAREQALSAQAFVKQVEASLERLNVELRKSKIHAPFSGTVLARLVDSGSVIAQGQTVFTLQQSDAAEVRIAMGADQAFTMKVGEEQTLQIPDFRGNRAVNNKVVARVKSIANSRNINTRTVDVIFELPNVPGILSGDLLTLTIPQTIREQGIWLPKSALASGVRGLWTVYTVAGNGKDQKIIPKSVAVLYNTAKNAYVSGALKEGDFVVIQGVHRLVPGQIVNADVAQSLHLANR